ncbi:hypothetical protein GCM10027040_32060 [Halomonas shantousis]
MRSTWLSSGVLLELMAIAGGIEGFSYLACGCFVTYFACSFRQLEGYAQLLATVAALSLAMVAFSGRMTLERLAGAAEAAAFYACFLGSLGQMQCLVRRFEVLRRIHDVLLGGTSLWLYPKYALASCAMGSVLNFGMMSVLCGGLAETLDQRGIRHPLRLEWLRCLLGVTLRGFALVPLIAPTSVAMAIVTREVPALSWGSLLPYTALAAGMFLLVGWGLERRRFTVISSQRVRLDGMPEGSLTLGGLVVVLLAAMGLIVTLMELNVSRAAMLMVPCITVTYLLISERRPRHAWREMTANTVLLRNEMCIFASSAALGTVLASLVPTDLVDPALLSARHELALAVAGMLTLPAAAALGIAPIAVLSFLAGVLARVEESGISALTIGTGLVIGFSLAMMLSPFGPSAMTLARFGRISKYTVAFGWNGLFALVSLPLMLVLLALMAW